MTNQPDRYQQKCEVFMAVAVAISTLSTCKRKACGSLLVTPDFSQIIAIGYNGPASGEPNDSCTGDKPCGCFHAEANCLIKPRDARDDLVLFVTRAPCRECAGLIINSKSIRRVFYKYDSTAGCEPGGGLELLSRQRDLIVWKLLHHDSIS